MIISDSDGKRRYFLDGVTIVETRTGQEVFSQSGRHILIVSLDDEDDTYELRPVECKALGEAVQP